MAWRSIYKIKCLCVKGDLPTLILSFLFERQQRVVVNWQESAWLTIKSSVPQVHLLVHWFLYIYIYTNNLSGNLKSNVNLFADDTSMFSVARDPINTSQKLKTDFDGVSLWANIWKMSFNPDPSKQAQKVILLLKINKVYHSPFLFNNSTIQQISTFRNTSWWRAYVQTSY